MRFYNQNKNISLSKYVLHHPAIDLKAANNDGDTFLHKLAKVYHFHFSYHVFKMILNAGVNINTRNKAGRTAIFFAAVCN